MAEISKSDWKLFRSRIVVWQERYMDRLTREYISLLSADEPASTRFWTLERRIREDKRNLGVQIELKRSTAYSDIAALVQDGVITMDDLDGFSDDLRGAVKSALNVHRTLSMHDGVEWP